MFPHKVSVLQPPVSLGASIEGRGFFYYFYGGFA